MFLVNTSFIFPGDPGSPQHPSPSPTAPTPDSPGPVSKPAPLSLTLGLYLVGSLEDWSRRGPDSGAGGWLPGAGRTPARPPTQLQGGPGGLQGGLMTGPVWCLSRVYAGAGFSGVPAFGREARVGRARAFGKGAGCPCSPCAPWLLAGGAAL